MRFKIILMSILFLVVAIIASQNTNTTELKFLFWSIQAPLIVMIVVIFILGLVIGLIFSSNYERKKKKEEIEILKKTEEKDNISNKKSIK
ncbi:MAG: LapA family protein [Ignavibacteriaceae bacterium]|jgi:lipopolysaccharide assembly protein A|nr:LapA family protein [Ignavibacteriaceae bacterium]